MLKLIFLLSFVFFAFAIDEQSPLDAYLINLKQAKSLEDYANKYNLNVTLVFQNSSNRADYTTFTYIPHEKKETESSIKSISEDLIENYFVYTEEESTRLAYFTTYDGYTTGFENLPSETKVYFPGIKIIQDDVTINRNISDCKDPLNFFYDRFGFYLPNVAVVTVVNKNGKEFKYIEKHHINKLAEFRINDATGFSIEDQLYILMEYWNFVYNDSTEEKITKEFPSTFVNLKSNYKNWAVMYHVDEEYLSSNYYVQLTHPYSEYVLITADKKD